MATMTYISDQAYKSLNRHLRFSRMTLRLVRSIVYISLSMYISTSHEPLLMIRIRIATNSTTQTKTKTKTKTNNISNTNTNANNQ